MAKQSKVKKDPVKKKAAPKKEESVMPMVTEDGEIMTLAQAKAAWKK